MPHRNISALKIAGVSQRQIIGSPTHCTETRNCSEEAHAETFENDNEHVQNKIKVLKFQVRKFYLINGKRIRFVGVQGAFPSTNHKKLYGPIRVEEKEERSYGRKLAE